MANTPNTPDPTSADGPPIRRQRDPARADRDRSGDVLAGPPDSSRPKNPWPRLLAFAFVLVAIVALAAMCVGSFASAPTREVRVRNSELQLDLPRFLPIQSFGHDDRGFTYGAYLAVPSDAGDPRAFLSRDPESGCNLVWNPTASIQGVIGAFVDPCTDARYDFRGAALHEDAPRDLHTIEVRRETNSWVVDFSEVTLGACRAATELCSTPDQPVTRRIPGGALPDDFGQR